MNVSLAMRALWRQKWILLAGVVAGVVLAYLALYEVTYAHGGLQAEARSYSKYSATAALVVDAPGFGSVRTDVPMDKSIQMAPTFAYLATTQNVLARVEQMTGGPLANRVKITAEAVQDSPIVTVSVEGDDPALVARVAASIPQAFSDYVSKYQTANGVAGDVRLVLRPLGSYGPPTKVQSRTVEIAAVLFLLPLLTAAGLAILIDNAQHADTVVPLAVVAAGEPGVPAGSSGEAAPVEWGRHSDVPTT
jgi:capsular polysaccharide biosynthesis protein